MIRHPDTPPQGETRREAYARQIREHVERLSAEIDARAHNVARMDGMSVLKLLDAARVQQEASEDEDKNVFGRAIAAESAETYRRAVDVHIMDVATGARERYVSERAALIAERERLQAQVARVNEARARLDRAYQDSTRVE